jgi:Leucine-rich repeat (LRR) protein
MYWQVLLLTPLLENTFLDWKDVIGGLITAFALGILLLFKKRILKWWHRTKTTQTAFESAEIYIAQKYFVANSIAMGNEKITDSIPYFFRTIFHSNTPFYYLIAPTGVGKTTFLVNLFLYCQHILHPTGNWFKLFYSKCKRQPKTHVILGKMYHEDTLFMIAKTIQAGEQRDTILLLDAMDEYHPSKANLNAAAYQQQFLQSWDSSIRPKLEQFKKVIISVREQFLQSEDVESIRISGHPIVKINLLPFSEDQCTTYLSKRYKDKGADVQNGIEYLVGHFRYKGLDFINLPIILNYMENIYAEYELNKNILQYEDSFFTTYNLYAIIIKQWFIREKIEKKFNDAHINTLQHACQELAFNIATGTSAGSYSLLLEELISFENTLNHNFTEGYGDRSLLVRSHAGNVNSTSISTHTFRFVHNSFMEFFLVQYALLGNTEEAKVPFDIYPLALQFFIRQQWEKSKSEFPKLEYQRDFGNAINPTIEQFESWLNFFQRLSSHATVQTALQEKGLLHFLEKKQIPSELFSIQEITLYNKNFWNKDYGQPYDITIELIPYIRDFFVTIHFEDIDISNHLHHFKYCRKIKKIDLRNAVYQNKDCLQNFEECIPNLELLYLAEIALTDKMLGAFKKSNKLKILSLMGNQLTGEGLCYFKNNKDLNNLDLRYNQITDEHLYHLASCKRIIGIALDHNKIEGAGLKTFEQSSPYIESLELSYNKIDDEALQYFVNATKITTLDLAGNRITGSGLGYLKNSIPHISIMRLQENKITDAHLHVLQHCRNLDVLNLNNNLLSGAFLSYLIYNQVLSFLSFSNNPIIASFLSPLKFVHTLKGIGLENTGITDTEFKHLLHNSQLYELEVSNNPAITGQHIITLFPALKKIAITNCHSFDQQVKQKLIDQQVQLIEPEDGEKEILRAMYNNRFVYAFYGSALPLS